jgi:predicted site-specific integrase-resolvase
MNLAGWAERNGVARVTAYRWFDAGLLAVPARKVGRPILVSQPGLAGQVAVKRGRQPATRPGNNPEMGCESRDH